MAKKIVLRFLALVAVAVAAAVALAYPQYRRDIDAARERVAHGSEIAQSSCGPIEYATLGSGPAVLLVHGAGGGFDQLLDMGRELARRGFRVVLPSRFGYLRTPLPADASPAAQADAHACLLDALKIDRAAVIGVSAGAPSSMQFALRHAKRCAALVLLVPLTWAPPEERRRIAPAAWLVFPTLTHDFLFWTMSKTAPGLVIETVLGTPPRVVDAADARERARVYAMMPLLMPVGPRQDGLRNEGRIAGALERYDLERIEVPALLVSAADDGYGTYAGARYTAARIKGARFVGYPSGGHMLAGRDADVTTELSAFLRANP